MCVCVCVWGVDVEGGGVRTLKFALFAFSKASWCIMVKSALDL